MDAFDSLATLAGWLDVTATELAWLADPRGILRRQRDPRLHHYHRDWVRKRSGGYRLIERPKPRLKAIQRRLLREVLEAIPVDEAAMGFVRGRSMVDHAALHADQAVVLRVDLEDFFASVTHARVVWQLRLADHPADVARTMAGLCTTSMPEFMAFPPPGAALSGPALLGRALSGAALSGAARSAADGDANVRARRRWYGRHLPQGAPTSPWLANLCARRLDRRLRGLADAVGARYSRYADDLVFSGDSALSRRADRLVPVIAAIAMDERFTVQFRKTRIMRRGQRQEIGGLVVNRRPQVRRAEYDRLRAVLTNCVRHGLDRNNRDGHPDFRAHLQGRIAWVGQTSPARGARLRALYDRISR
ncbi:MAG: reverse transcriptase family protein [Myxococcota bacterium]